MADETILNAAELVEIRAHTEQAQPALRQEVNGWFVTCGPQQDASVRPMACQETAIIIHSHTDIPRLLFDVLLREGIGHWL